MHRAALSCRGGCGGRMSAGGWQAMGRPDLDLTAVLRADDGCRMCDPGEASAIRAAESALGVRFPADLRALYMVSDGVFDEPGQWFVIWPLAELVARNQAARAGKAQPAADCWLSVTMARVRLSAS